MISRTVTLGQYNVRNWFAKEDENPELGKREKPSWSLELLAQNMDRSGADVLTLQEVGTSLDNVKDFFNQAPLKGKFPYVAMENTNDTRGVHVVIASRYPITQVVSHAQETFPLADGTALTRFSRDLLRADIDVQGIPFTVYTTHGKSRRVYAKDDPAHPGGDNPDNQRIGEGRAIGAIVAREMKPFPGRLYVVTGDLNDGTEDPSVQAILNHPEGEKLFDTLSGLPEKERRTWPADPAKSHGHSPEQFDHILVPLSQKEKVLDSSIIDIPRVSQKASDHLEVVATFQLEG